MEEVITVTIVVLCVFLVISFFIKTMFEDMYGLSKYEREELIKDIFDINGYTNVQTYENIKKTLLFECKYKNLNTFKKINRRFLELQYIYDKPGRDE